MSARLDVVGQVTRPGVAEGHGGVLRPPGEQQAQRTADGDAPADHHDLGAVDRHVVLPQEPDDAARRAGQRGVDHVDQPAQVDRVEAVGVLGGVDALQQGHRVEVARQRELHDVAVAGRVGVELVDDVLDLAGRRVGGQLALDRGDADLGAVAVLAGDVDVAGRVVADQDGAQTRVTPASASLPTRSASSSLILAAVALPSRIPALMYSPSGRSGGCR